MKKLIILLGLILIIINVSLAIAEEEFTPDYSSDPQEGTTFEENIFTNEVIESGPEPAYSVKEPYDVNKHYTLYNFPVLPGESADSFQIRYEEYFKMPFDSEKWQQMLMNYKKLALEKSRLRGQIEELIIEKGELPATESGLKTDLDTITKILDGSTTDAEGFTRLLDKSICNDCIPITTVALPEQQKSGSASVQENTNIITTEPTTVLAEEPTAQAGEEKTESSPKPSETKTVAEGLSDSPQIKSESVFTKIVSFFNSLFS